MSNKVKLTFVLPLPLQGEMKQKMFAHGYSHKKKSTWVEEAIVDLLDIQAYPELVKISDEMRGFEKLESVLVTRILKKRIEEAVLIVRKIYPEMNGVQSRILRTAIVQRLLRQ